METMFSCYIKDLTVDRKDDAQTLETAMNNAKNYIPEYLRAGKTCFTTFFIQGELVANQTRNEYA
eukprot:199354-Ditylum_brightwellii.AAC.1